MPFRHTSRSLRITEMWPFSLPALPRRHRSLRHDACSLGPMEHIDRSSLINQIGQNGQLALIEVLPPEEYGSGHLPRAINIPLGDDFEDTVDKVIPDRDLPVVVYCASETCDASPKAAERLEKMGYENVMDYSGGKKDWKDAGLRLVRNDL